MKRKALILFSVIMMLTMIPCYMAGDTDYTQYAEVLKDLGLFNGTNKGFELERAPKRIEVAAMLVKFLGAEEEASQKMYTHPFTDVPSWADHLVGYMYEKGLTTGISKSLFGSNNLASAKDYTVFVLKALGYDLTDFSYADTMKFAVEKGVFTADEKANLETGTFSRGKMVYLSYRSLFTNLKSGDGTLGAKLGKKNIETIEPPIKVMLKRTQNSDKPGSVIHKLDKSTMPAPYNEFEYLEVTGLSSNMPIDMSVITYLIPTKNSEDYRRYNNDTGSGDGKYDRTVFMLFDADKKLLGYFDISGKEQFGNIPVEIKPATPYVLKIPEFNSGTAINAKGEIVIDREKLPVEMKNYAKIAIEAGRLEDKSVIEYEAKSIVYENYNKSVTKGNFISGLNNASYVSDQITLFLYDESNKCLGYAYLDGRPIIKLMKAELDKKGIVDIKKGLAYIENYGKVSVYPNIGELSEYLDNPYSYSVTGFNLDFNPVSAAYSKYSNVVFTPRVMTLDGFGSSNGMSRYMELVTVYNKDNELLGYHKITEADINNRPDLFKTVRVHLAEPTSIPLHAGHFTVSYYIDGILDEASTRKGGYSTEVRDAQGKIIAVDLLNVFYIPSLGLEIKVESNEADVTVKSIELK